MEFGAGAGSSPIQREIFSASPEGRLTVTRFSDLFSVTAESFTEMLVEAGQIGVIELEMRRARTNLVRAFLILNKLDPRFGPSWSGGAYLWTKILASGG
jgi:hypothetical protein